MVLIGAETMSAPRSFATQSSRVPVANSSSSSASSSLALGVVVDDHAEIAEARRLEPLVEAERGHGVLPVVRAGELEHQRLAVAVVEAWR